MTEKQKQAKRERTARQSRQIEERTKNAAIAVVIYDENGKIAVQITGYWTKPRSGWMLHATMRVMPRTTEIQDTAEALGYDRWTIAESDVCGGCGFNIRSATMESLMYQMRELFESPAMGLHYPTDEERDTDLSCYLHNYWYKIFTAKGWTVCTIL